MYFVKLMKKYVARERRRGPAADFGGEPPVFSLEPNVQRERGVVDQRARDRDDHS